MIGKNHAIVLKTQSKHPKSIDKKATFADRNGKRKDIQVQTIRRAE